MEACYSCLTLGLEGVVAHLWVLSGSMDSHLDCLKKLHDTPFKGVSELLYIKCTRNSTMIETSQGSKVKVNYLLIVPLT